MGDVYPTAELAASIGNSECLEDSVRAMTAVAMDAVLSLLQEFVRAPGAESFLRLEERLFRDLVQLAAAFTALALQTVCRKNITRAARSSNWGGGKSRWQGHGLRETPVQFLGGLTVLVSTPYSIRTPATRRGRKRRVGRRGPAGGGRYPLLRDLGIRDGVTPALQSAIARQAARCDSFEEAREVLLEQGTSLDVKTVHRIALLVADGALTQRRARVQASQDGAVYSREFTGQRVLIGVDGGRLRCREGGERGRRRANGRRGFQTPWREPKLMSAHVIDDAGHPVESVPPLYEATMGGADEAFDLFIAELKLHGIAEAREVIVAADGASWIWNRTKDLPSKVGFAEEKMTRVADFYHAVEHLQAVAQSRTDWPLEDVKAWVTRKRRLLRNGHVDKVIAGCRALRRSNSKLVTKEMNYFQRLAPFMAFDQYRKRGIPLGSGATESAIRRVVNLRLKAPGTFWKPENAERMLHLRAYLKSGRWPELMSRVLHASPHGQTASLGAVMVPAPAAA